MPCFSEMKEFVKISVVGVAGGKVRGSAFDGLVMVANVNGGKNCLLKVWIFAM
ncbi:MAG: hypothetical protein HRU72_14485 [Planctomycetia bacterium]|nr:MAG: hypothetical protein HRU72_14485 [Planctomycetia bacterium]HQU31522.1 hypothetical protein [Candidatus Brocadia sapporoensis]